ncbi:MAG: hypothetical protein JWM93_894 [Frankiales bacterium]|nr:hypothetical protein [Frankiales bacterium]
MHPVRDAPEPGGRGSGITSIRYDGDAGPGLDHLLGARRPHPALHERAADPAPDGRHPDPDPALADPALADPALADRDREPLADDQADDGDAHPDTHPDAQPETDDQQPETDAPTR